MNIAGLDKAEVLAALYNNSKQQGMGFMDKRGADRLTIDQAREELIQKDNKYFDYLYGRVMKIDLSSDELNTKMYNRDNGEGSAEKFINGLMVGVQQ